jgi:hypothetical protein
MYPQIRNLISGKIPTAVSKGSSSSSFSEEEKFSTKKLTCSIKKHLSNFECKYSYIAVLRILIRMDYGIILGKPGQDRHQSAKPDLDPHRSRRAVPDPHQGQNSGAIGSKGAIEGAQMLKMEA